MVPIDFQVTSSKVKVKPLFSAHCVVRSISFDPFIWSIPNFVQGLITISRWSLLIFRSHVQRSRSNHSLRSSNDSEILAFLPFDHDNVFFYSYLIMFSSALYKVLNSKCHVHISSNFEFCTKGGIYVSETFLVVNWILFPTDMLKNENWEQMIHSIDNRKKMYMSAYFYILPGSVAAQIALHVKFGPVVR